MTDNQKYSVLRTSLARELSRSDSPLIIGDSIITGQAREILRAYLSALIDHNVTLEYTHDNRLTVIALTSRLTLNLPPLP